MPDVFSRRAKAMRTVNDDLSILLGSVLSKRYARRG